MASGFPGGPDFYGGRSMGGGGSGVPIIGNPAPTTTTNTAATTTTNQDLMGMYRFHQQQQFSGGILPESNQIGNRRADSTTMIGKRPFGQFQSPPCTSTTTTSSGYTQRNNNNTLQQQLALLHQHQHQHQQNQNQMFLIRQNLLQQQQGGGMIGGGGGGLFPRSVKQRTNPLINNSYQSPLSQILPAVAGRGLSPSNNNLSHTSSSTISSSSSSSSSSSYASSARFGVPLYQQQQQQPPFSSTSSSSSSSLGLGLGLGSKNLGSGTIGYSNSNSNSNYICSNRVGSETGPLESETNNNNNDDNSSTVVMMSLKQLEKELLGDDGDFLTGEDDAVSVITNSDWSEAFQNFLPPTTTISTPPLPPPQTTKDGTSPSVAVAVASNNNNSSSNNNNNNVTISPSPTSSTSSSCSSSATPPPNNPTPCPTTVSAKQLISQAALAISDGKSDEATEALSRLSQVSERMGSPDQKLAFYMLHALRCRASPSENPAPVGELFSAEHRSSFHALCELSPCFKFPLLAANLAMLETIKEEMKMMKKNSITVHIVDFDVGAGGQYVNLLRALPETQAAHRLEIKITAVDIACLATGVGGGGGEGLVVVVEEKKKHHHHHHQQMKVMKVLEGVRDTLLSRTGLDLNLKFNHVARSVTELSRESLGCEEGEILLVNLAYRMFRVPDESVSMDNPRDELLRRVKRMEPRLVTLVEQDINANTSPFPTRASECASYYGSLLDSLDSRSTLARDSPDRLSLEAALGRKAANALACEGRDRVERCEVFGKWRARMTMAGFEARPIATVGLADSMRSKMCDSGPGRAGTPNFMVKEEAFGICFGWMGRILTVASAWR